MEHSRIKILFVCLGNICRSPAAEAIFKHMVSEKGFSDRVEVDSAGLNGYHDGENADPRMIKYASKRGYRITSISRRIIPSRDFDYFDLIVGMDDYNYKELIRLSVPYNATVKVKRMTDFSEISAATEVPDPYYGGTEGFENVLDILEDCSGGLLKQITS